MVVGCNIVDGDTDVGAYFAAACLGIEPQDSVSAAGTARIICDFAKIIEVMKYYFILY